VKKGHILEELHDIRFPQLHKYSFFTSPSRSHILALLENVTTAFTYIYCIDFLLNPPSRERERERDERKEK
jgi:hypothetical protein